MNSKNKNNSDKNYGDDGNLNLKLVVTLKRCLNSISKNVLPIFQEAGLTESQFGILEVLYHKGSLPICEIIRKTLSSGGNMTVVIDNLEKAQLVERAPDPNDRRSFIISLSKKGKTLIKKTFPVHVEHLNKMLGILNSEEKYTLIELAKKLGKSA
jgi:DNA-binding MarR family transcriptional regulator